MNSEKIKVLIVDDHSVVLSGLSAFLMVYDELELVGEASDGKEAVELCAILKPDVVLMDMLMPVMDGAQATFEIKQKCPNTQIIILTSFKEDTLVQKAIKSGAIGYLLKNASADELVSAIKAAKAGRPTLSPEATQVLVKSATEVERKAEELTHREKEVLNLMILGLNNPDIASKLFLSVSTVKFHVSSILSKLSAQTRTEAVAIAIQSKLDRSV